MPRAAPRVAAEWSVEQPKVGAARRTADKRPPRKPTLLPGLVTHEHAALPVAIRVTNMSASGASLVVVSGERPAASLVEDMPDNISLFLTYDRFSVACVVKWRRGDKLGVQFVSVPRILEKPPARPRTPAKK
jgi:hypothetical protein